MKKLLYISILLVASANCLWAQMLQSKPIDSFPNTLLSPRLEYGVATLKGDIFGNPLQTLSVKNIPTIMISNPAKPYVVKNIFFNDDMTFELAIPVLGISNFVITSTLFNVTGILIPGKTTRINIDIKDPTNPKINSDCLLELAPQDLQKIGEALPDITGNMPAVDYGIDNSPKPDEYLKAYFARLQKTDQLIKKVDNLTDNAKYIFHKIIWDTDCCLGLFKYHENTKKKYNLQHKTFEGYKKHPIDRSYYRFLKNFDLNNPQSLYSFSNSDVMCAILADDVLNIPDIGSMPLENWQTETKGIFNDLIGDNNQFFIDLLTLNAYSRQIQNSKPLSPAQIQDIKTYFTTGNLADFLLDENNNILETLHRTSELHPLVINQTPESAKGELLKNIVAKYKGKVVFVDFWATWCGPCIAGMQLSKPVKSEYSQKDVAFVYIASTNSPEESWKNKIPQIGGEHYYLSMEKDDEIMDQYNFSTIPMYMIFDKEGNLLHQEGSISPAKMREWLDEALKK